jgi:hypothetical protein
VYTRKFRYLMDKLQKNNSFVERREKPRMKCAYHAMVRGLSKIGKKFEENATVINLSASGAYLLLNRFIDLGQDLSVKIAFPTGSLELGSSNLSTKGIVVRKETLSEGVIGIAIQLQRYRFV